VERHILRNLITLHALESGWPLPIGTQSAAMLDTLVSDADEEFAEEESEESTNDANEREFEWEISVNSREFADDLESYRARAAQVYQTYRGPFHHRFHWLEPKFFRPDLRQDLLDDAQALLQVLQEAGQWQPSRDAKLEALHRLLTKTHPRDKVLVFTQFADTALYLAQQLKARGVDGLAVVTSQSHHPTALARRFSPRSNGGLRNGETELRVLIATDVLAEGQNLQEAYVVVNFDLPWAIIRLIQRDGRVDRIGQEHGTILVYSFLPAEGVEAIIHLRSRLRHRLEQNQEVVGTDESFFGEEAAHKLRDLYTEKAGVLDDDEDEDVDFSSIALQVWNSASEKDRQAAQQLPPVVGAARPLAEEQKHAGEPSGVITYLRFPDGTDALVRVDEQGHLVSQSLTAAFRAAACAPDTPLRPRADHHHELVGKAVEWAVQEQVTPGGQLGSLRSIRRKVYERLKPFRERLQQQPTLFSGDLLKWLSPALDTLYRFPLRESARDALARQIRLGIADEGLAEMVVRFHEDDRLCHVTEEIPQPEPHIVCSLGLRTEPK
jgi:hypothetical protein